jgi:hypothetical protein
MASITIGVMIVIQNKIRGMVESGRFPFIGTMAIVAIGINCVMVNIFRFLMASDTITFVQNHIVIKSSCTFPTFGLMATIAIGRNLFVKIIGWRVMAAFTITNYGICK